MFSSVKYQGKGDGYNEYGIWDGVMSGHFFIDSYTLQWE